MSARKEQRKEQRKVVRKIEFTDSIEFSPSIRYVLRRKLGSGTFSKCKCCRSFLTVDLLAGDIYAAYDKHAQMKVALKVERSDKNKIVLVYEYHVLINVQGISLFTLVSSHLIFLQAAHTCQGCSTSSEASSMTPATTSSWTC